MTALARAIAALDLARKRHQPTALLLLKVRRLNRRQLRREIRQRERGMAA